KWARCWASCASRSALLWSSATKAETHVGLVSQRITEEQALGETLLANEGGPLFGGSDAAGRRQSWLSRRIDVCGDRTRGCADRCARAAVGLHSCKEDWVHAAVDARRHRGGGHAAADQLGSLDVVTTLHISD